jgi:hypothetical protein
MHFAAVFRLQQIFIVIVHSLRLVEIILALRFSTGTDLKNGRLMQAYLSWSRQ